MLESLQTIPLLNKVIIIGVNDDWKLHVPTMKGDNVSILSEHDMARNFQSKVHSIMGEIPTESVYISIDKDVLKNEEAATAWDHGSMKLSQIQYILEYLSSLGKEVIGLDICGEYSFSPTERYKKESERQ